MGFDAVFLLEQVPLRISWICLLVDARGERVQSAQLG